MNPSKVEQESDPFFLHHHHLHHHHNHHFHHRHHPPFDPHHHHNNHHNRPIIDIHDTLPPHSHSHSLPDPDSDPPFSLLDSPSSSSPSTSPPPPSIPISSQPKKTLTLASDVAPNDAVSGPIDPPDTTRINPEPHISSQFYTFNCESHSLMISCLLEGRVASPVEIRSVTPVEVLKSWRSVWKDRNEDTAYLTAWKRIQDKLHAHVDGNGNRFLCFKNNANQFVSHVDQWQEIVMGSHSDTDMKHLGLRETIDKIKQLWTVGAKFYGIPESFIRVCIASCPVCSGVSDGVSGGVGGFSGGRPKRRRFEYTESFDVPAKEVPNKLQQLAKKHKVVLCIRQKYIRYKPFMAEVKDYACHRAGEPASSKKSKILKREPYASKRCGCGFRIRAIVPITNYNEKDKTFVYQEEGVAVFKLYAVHTGHEPGPLDGNARIMHRVVGHKGAFLTDQDTEYGVNEDMENDPFATMGRDEGDIHHSVLQQVHELRSEVGLLEGRIGKLPPELLESVSRDLFDIVNKVRILGDEASKSMGLLSDKPHSDVMLVGEGHLPHWSDPHDDALYGDDKETDLIEDEDVSFGRTLGEVAPWDQMRTECRSEKDMLSDSCKPDKWLNSSDFDEKSILDCEDSKLTKPMRHDDTLDEDVGLVGIQVDSFYPENPKWYDSPCGLDSSTDCGDSFRGEIV